MGLPSGRRFTDSNCFDMEMVLIPTGEFLMGSADDDSEADDYEKPRHRVRWLRDPVLPDSRPAPGSQQSEVAVHARQ